MGKLRLTLACGDYDRTHALLDGSVQPDGVDLNYMRVEPPGEVFWRQLRHEEFDASELTLSAYTLGLARADTRFVAIPVFPLRAFRHSFIWVREGSGIDTPGDLIGKRVGIPEYHMTAMLYIRGMLKHDYGVEASDITWYRSRVERVSLNLPSSVHIEDVGPERALDQMLASGEIDAVAGTRAPQAARSGSSSVRRLFADPRAVELDYFQRTGIFPIMHVIAIRRELYEQNRWVAKSLLDAFEAAKAVAYHRLQQVSGMISLPWINLDLEDSRRVFGADPFPYGLEPNRTTLEAAALYSYEQGLSEHQIAVEELFAPETIDVFVEH